MVRDDVERIGAELAVGERGDIVDALTVDQHGATIDVGEPESHSVLVSRKAARGTIEP